MSEVAPVATSPITPLVPSLASLPIDPLAGAVLPESSRSVALGADQVRFNLADIYTGIDDPRIRQDLDQIEQLYRDFSASYRGKLLTELGSAVETIEQISRLENKVAVYGKLLQSCDEQNQDLRRLTGQVRERLFKAAGEHYSFFDIEVAKISDADYQSLIGSDPRVQKYEPFLTKIRNEAKHNLSEEVERALALRAPFGSNEWSEYFRERSARQRFLMTADVFAGEDFYQKGLSQEEILKVMNSNPRREVRAEAMRIFNEGLADESVPLMARVLNVVSGTKNVTDAERKYDGIMSSRNENNMVKDKVVESLHQATADTGAALAQRYYKLMAAHLGVDTLLWSDRNAPLNRRETKILWQDAVSLVKEAYRSFSPTLADLVDGMFENGWIDAPYIPGKGGGAFNMSVVLPEPAGARSYTFLNYLGETRDVATLAHELGHGVHGMLAGTTQGALMSDAPIAYCETASIFAEMVTFEFLKNRIDSPEEKLTLLMGKIGDFMNSVVRQISFSTFEQMLHEERKEGKLTTEQLGEAWMKVTTAFYGKEGDVFNYQNMENLWSYISHFFKPFYVYGYSFGELLTQSLFAVKDSYGDAFEPLYLDLLRAGGTKDATELLKPFGLNPEDPAFWQRGMEASVGKWINEAEALSRELGIIQ